MTSSAAAAEIAHGPLGTSAGEVVAWLGAGVILVMLGRVIHDRAFRYLAACLVAFALNRVLSSMDDKPDVLVLVTNLLTVVSALCKVCFFRIVLGEAVRQRMPRLRFEYVAAAMVALIAICAWWMAPAEARGGALAGPSYAHDNAAFTFVIVLIGYYTVVAARVVNWTRQLIVAWVRRRPKVVHTHGGGPDLSQGTGQVVAGLAFQVGVVVIGIGEITRLVSNVSKLANEILARLEPDFLPLAEKFSPAITAGVRVGHSMFYIGAILPLVVGSAAAALMSVHHYRNCRRLKPLWSAITDEFTDLAYRGARGIGGKFYRRDVEIRDGLVLLENYYDPEVARRAATLESSDEITVAVAQIRAALRAHRAESPVAVPSPIPVSDAATRVEDMSWLLRVADEFVTAERAEGNFAAAQSR
ncbi:hypothetical protein AD006_31390 (plasmid) [Pseudonocardia sp. EC080610-09]|uniref:MAB_1171c family putative transporter n=1 Tax=unclassified Pseudonocardia TaxID=2619320 RepID=UPI000705A526|nr:MULTISPECIES: MAB_1171c family putative transporter [unclassified Pseudonocardia]ALL79674.1 hypothetical protein AD006_31390 [Pseudonocardia sp. EC080610-09]ALL85371.1 hypothetical protein AD017_29850 [Pseudonocardia sp. EC080619-01]